MLQNFKVCQTGFFRTNFCNNLSVNHRILDHFGQPYFDTNIVFRLKGSGTREQDAALREKYLVPPSKPDSLRRRQDQENFDTLGNMQKEFKSRIEKFYADL